MPTARAAADLAPNRFLDEVRRRVADALRGREATVYLFGSFATGGAHRSSDIDVAIDAAAPLPPALLSQLREELEDSRVPYRVDLVDLADADPAFRERVRRTGRVWIERASA